MVLHLFERDGIGQQPCFWRLASKPQKELVLDSRRNSNCIPPLSADPLNAKDGAVRQVAENVFEDLGGVECSLSWRIIRHGASSPARCGVEGGFDLLGKLLALAVAW